MKNRRRKGGIKKGTNATKKKLQRLKIEKSSQQTEANVSGYFKQTEHTEQEK